VRHSRRACRVQRHAIGKVQKVEMHQRGPFRLTPLARNFGSRHLAAGAALRHCSCIASKPHGVTWQPSLLIVGYRASAHADVNFLS
jgi:hypothetical protein